MAPDPTAGETTTVAIPVLNGGALFEEVLAAVFAQRLEHALEVVVADSGSSDGSRARARAYGAEVVEIPGGEFSHGGTRNLLMERSSGSRVAFLTQDAVPADQLWLARLLEGFSLAEDVALVFGPYLPRPGASLPVRRELTEWFASFSPDGRPRLDRLPSAPTTPPRLGPGPRVYFTDANGCVARWAWKEVPFRRASYAEDQVLARDMLIAGYAKVFQPGAPVVHSHEYGSLEQFRRFFDEWRGLREAFDYVAPVGPRLTPRTLRREVAADLAFRRSEGASPRELLGGLRQSVPYYAVRALGSALGSRADRLPARARRWCSLESRDTFEPSAASPRP